jgi:hypothetical protein
LTGTPATILVQRLPVGDGSGTVVTVSDGSGSGRLVVVGLAIGPAGLLAGVGAALDGAG